MHSTEKKGFFMCLLAQSQLQTPDGGFQERTSWEGKFY